MSRCRVFPVDGREKGPTQALVAFFFFGGAFLF